MNIYLPFSVQCYVKERESQPGKQVLMDVVPSYATTFFLMLIETSNWLKSRTGVPNLDISIGTSRNHDVFVTFAPARIINSMLCGEAREFPNRILTYLQYILSTIPDYTEILRCSKCDQAGMIWRKRYWGTRKFCFKVHHSKHWPWLQFDSYAHLNWTVCTQYEHSCVVSRIMNITY